VPMRWVNRVVLVTGAGLLIAGLAVALWPLHVYGASGSALLPHYARELGFQTTSALPLHPTPAELSHAGVHLPQVAVGHRRHLAELIGGAGLAVLVVCSVFVARRPRG
jgi:hypothetical protein